MKNMRLSCWLAMTVLAMVLLAGCSNGNDNNNPDMGGTTSQTQESTSGGTTGEQREEAPARAPWREAARPVRRTGPPAARPEEPG